MAKKNSNTRKALLDLLEKVVEFAELTTEDPKKYYGKSPQKSLLRKHRQQLANVR